MGDRLLEYITDRHIQLADAPLETELVRKRCGVFAPSPMDDKRTFKEIIEASGCFGYIGAPITVQGRAIGILHADRPEPHGIVTMDHLEQLEAFAECLSVAFESAALEEKAAQQRVEVDNLCGNVDELLGRSARSVLWSLPGAVPVQRHDAYHRGDQPAVPALTSREREIMSHVATGATNRPDCPVPGDLRRDSEVPSETHCEEAQYVQQGSGGRDLRRHRQADDGSHDEHPRDGGQAQRTQQTTM